MIDEVSKRHSHDGEHEPSPPDRLLSLAACAAAVLLGALLLVSLVATLSRQGSMLTSPANALPAVAVALAAILLLVYPLWPGTLLGGDPLNRFWLWLLLRVAETAALLAVAVPFLIVAAVFSGEPFARVAEVAAGLSGTAAVAILYRFSHQAGSRRLRGVALLDALMFLFAPLVVGYLALEFHGASIGWGWLISPLALAREVALSGLALRGAAFLVGVVGYAGAAGAGLAIARPLARRFSEKRQRQSELQDRPEMDAGGAA